MYDSISESGADGFGQGANGYGQGYNGSVYGGNPGGVQNPISVNGSGGAQPPISITSAGGGMSPGEGIPGRIQAGRPGASSAQGSIKPMLSQLLGLSPQQPQGQRRGLGGQQRRPGMGGPGRPIMGGPRPIPRPMPSPVPAPAPAPGGGTIRGGGGQGPVSGPRGRVQPGRRQGTI